ncbi:MAG: inorganic diphosphatase [Bacteroidales bacterium]
MLSLLLRRFSPLLLFLLFACHHTDYSTLPPMGEDHWIRMVVETPAGQNFVSRYDSENKIFIPTVQLNKSLPENWNLGFVPAGSQKKAEQNYRLVEVLLLSSPKTQGTVLKIIPLGMLRMQTGDGPRVLLLAAPADPSDRLAGTETPEEMAMVFPEIFEQVEKNLALTVYKANPQSLTWADPTKTWQFIFSMIEIQ